MTEPQKPIITIGIPTFNSEKTLPKTIESVLNQTFKNFRVIISDNASTDSTSNISMKYVENDSRIKYIKQEKNIRLWPNFRFLLNSSKTKYFVWLSSDDFWEPTFLEKNIEVLESKKNFVCSVSEVDFYGKFTHRYQINDKFPKNTFVKPFIGNTCEKIKLLFKTPATIMYGIYHTDLLKKFFPKSSGWLHEYEFLMPLLQSGDFNVVDEVLLHRNSEGTSSSSQYSFMRSSDMSILDILFMNWPIFQWIIQNLGIKFILKNFPSYLHLIYVSYGRIVLDLLRSIRKN